MQISPIAVELEWGSQTRGGAQEVKGPVIPRVKGSEEQDVADASRREGVGSRDDGTDVPWSGTVQTARGHQDAGMTKTGQVNCEPSTQKEEDQLADGLTKWSSNSMEGRAAARLELQGKEGQRNRRKLLCQRRRDACEAVQTRYHAKPLSPRSKRSAHVKRRVVARLWSARTLLLEPDSLGTVGSISREVFAHESTTTSRHSSVTTPLPLPLPLPLP